jgi:acetolactate synthase-1/2/3 large subunit
MTVMRGADGILETLREDGTDLVVGYIGHTTQELADASQQVAGLRAVHPATELGGAHMINGYNIVKGRAAAAGIWHTCGTMLIPAALMEGMESRIPSVHLGLNVDAEFKDREAMQEMNHLEVLRPLTRYATRVERPGKLPEAIHRAVQRSQGNPMGPTFLDIPFDLTIDTAEMQIPTGGSVPSTRVGVNPDDAQAIAAMLISASRPVLVVGGGTVASGAAEEIKQLAELLGIPVTTTHTAQGILSELHPMSLGSSGPIGWKCANEWLNVADVVLAVGTRTSEWGWAQSYGASLEGRLIHIDLDPAQIGNFYFPEIGVAADAKTTLRQVIETVRSTSGFESKPFQERDHYAQFTKLKQEWLKEMGERATSDETPISPWRVMRDIESQLSPEDIIVSDAGNNTGWVFQGAVSERHHRLITSYGAGILGAGFPMALGVKMAAPHANVVAAVGDGGFGYGTNEISFALRENVPVTVVVFNDGELGANYGFMNYLYGEASWTHLENPDFAALAKAYGAQGERVESPDQIADAVRRGIDSQAPYIIDVPISQKIGYPATGGGAKVRWEPRQWPLNGNGTQAPANFARR